MASSPKRKRRPSDHSPQHQIQQSKRVKLDANDSPSDFYNHLSKIWLTPSEFYDRLSKVWLTSRALQEHNWRNTVRNPPSKRDRAVTEHQIDEKNPTQGAAKVGLTTLARFARAGGPDLCDLRGYPYTMASIPVSKGSTSASGADPAKPGQTARSKRSSPYDSNFEQALIDNNIFFPFRQLPDNSRVPKPTNFNEVLRCLEDDRRSLSPSGVTDSEFEDFQYKTVAGSEDSVMSNIVPYLTGQSCSVPNARNVKFVNLSSITGDETVLPQPDFFDGVQHGDVRRQVREDLKKTIIPSKQAKIPIVPNFFLEGKGPDGKGDVATRQVVQDGAYGASAIKALQRYGREEAADDNNAYTFSATLAQAQLVLYAHHIVTPENPEQRPSFYINQIGAYSLTNNKEDWLKGLRAFRNLRDLAKKNREKFVKLANEAHTVTQERDRQEADDVVVNEEEPRGSASPADFFDCHDGGDGSRPEDGGGDKSDDNDDNEPTISQETGVENAEMQSSFTSGFASNLTGGARSRTRSELSNSPPSPSSSRRYDKRSRR